MTGPLGRDRQAEAKAAAPDKAERIARVAIGALLALLAIAFGIIALVQW